MVMVILFMIGAGVGFVFERLWAMISELLEIYREQDW